MIKGLTPVLLQPRICSLRNRWRQNLRSRAQLGRALILALITLGIVLSIYSTTVAVLTKLHAHIEVAYFPPSMPLGLVLMFLFMLLLFSSSVSALGALYLGSDLDLVLSAPLGTPKFFLGKFLEIFASSSWMALLFGIPSIVAFGHFYNMHTSFYLSASGILVPYLMLPVACACIAVTALTTLVPASRTRPILLAILVGTILSIYLIARLIVPTDPPTQSIGDFLRVMAILSLPHTTWAPSYWAATCIGELLQGSGMNFWPYLIMLYASAACLTALAYLFVRFFHISAYSKAKTHGIGSCARTQTRSRTFMRRIPFLSAPYQAIMVKEFKVFARDMTHAIQFLLLVGLCLIYLYNFKILQSVRDLPELTRLWWQAFLIITNLGMGAFVLTAVCTRFVFPSLSLEGQAFWIIQSSPLKFEDILRAKFWCWVMPVATVSCIIFASGALAINAEPHIVIVSALSSWIMCYGIVGLGIGLGALYSFFDWEHSSQLAASMGSLVYMLSSVVLIFLDMMPFSLLVGLRTLRACGYEMSTPHWYLAIGTTALMLSYLNFVAARWAMRIGANALAQRMGG